MALDLEGIPLSAGETESEFRPRPYQVEMIEESLKRNIIVAMDTGSGKTHIAIARAQIELERCESRQLVWFLAPTVTLCDQQYQLFQRTLPAYQARFLSGEDNVERWTDQRVWDDILKNIRIVFSTHAVLLDALTHGFVSMSQLALIIFDEAHHCTRNHPANQIMANFYRPLLANRTEQDTPRVLGLSASPVINTKVGALESIEQNLNAVVKTPKRHREELAKYVHMPTLKKAVYQRSTLDDRQIHGTAALRALSSAYMEMNIMDDPYVKELQEALDSDPRALDKLSKVLLQQKTYCREQMKQLCAKAGVIFEELGGWAADWFIKSSITKFTHLFRRPTELTVEWSEAEQRYLATLLNKVEVELTEYPAALEQVSAKVQALTNILQDESFTAFKALIFVEQRATVAALAQLLATNVGLEDKIGIGTFVGTSNSAARKTRITELVELRNQQQTLESFKRGEINLIVTTNVLEEGIDVSSCNAVICFDPPKNLKSFIQRRGRARKQQSKYIFLIANDDPKFSDSSKWQDLEQRMKEAYLDDLRSIQQPIQVVEKVEERRQFRIASTGALLTLDNAVAHLYHFCATLREHYVDYRPQFTISEDENSMIRAEIFLPNSVDPAVRRAASSKPWTTERMAKRDAAFEAYLALHRAGLVNDNLLPLTKDMKDLPEMNATDDGPSQVTVGPTIDPWFEIASLHTQSSKEWSLTRIEILNADSNGTDLIMLLPTPMFSLPPFTVYWNQETQLQVRTSLLGSSGLSPEYVLEAQKATRLLLQSVHGTRMTEQRLDFVALFIPFENVDILAEWNTSMSGTRSAVELHSLELSQIECTSFGLVRSRQSMGDVYMFQRFSLETILETLEGIEQATEKQTINAIKFPKRRDFLNPVPDYIGDINSAYTRVHSLLAEDYTIDNLPASYSIFSLLLPSILHRYGSFKIAELLRNGPLAPVAFANLELVLTAITASSANQKPDYQRLEFLGDSILKFCTSIQLMAQHGGWPEKYLTAEKGRTNSNKFLSKVCLRAGLDQFIIRKPFAGVKWQPKYVASALNNEDLATGKSVCSTKVLADVVEALIGASFVEGGLEKALLCIKTLLPDEQWYPFSYSHNLLFDMAPTVPFQPHLLESLIGYNFRKKSLLLEAMTHASLNSYQDSTLLSYQRLEFLGDAVLDYVVVGVLFAGGQELPHHIMHSIRTAVVNASFLAFLCFSFSIAEERAEIEEKHDVVSKFKEKLPNLSGTDVKTTKKHVNRSLWQFMRHSSPAIMDAQQAALKRFDELTSDISTALESQSQYPWSLLTRLHADKFFSDLVESVIGAIYIDSNGNTDECAKFLDRLGLLKHLRRIIRENVDCIHPKERLGQMANQDKVTYVHEREGTLWRCRVKIGGQPIGEVVEGQSRFDAETRAASEAITTVLQANDNIAIGAG